jgi:CRP-like cAMP-binding protein
MSKSQTAATPPTHPSPVDWTGARTQRVEYLPSATIFAQGDDATSVMYVEQGAVRLSVLSHAGKEAVVAVLDVAHFFGEGAWPGNPSGWRPRPP